MLKKPTLNELLKQVGNGGIIDRSSTLLQAIKDGLVRALPHFSQQIYNLNGRGRTVTMVPEYELTEKGRLLLMNVSYSDPVLQLADWQYISCSLI